LRRTLSVTAANLVARFAHLVLFIMVGNRFGANATTDSVFFLYAPLTVIMAVSASVADTVVMPAVHRAQQVQCVAAIRHLFVRTALLLVPVLSICVLLVARNFTPGVSWPVLMMMTPIPVFAALSAQYIGFLNAEARHGAAAISPLYGSLLAAPAVFVLPLAPWSLVTVLMLFELGRTAGMRAHLVGSQGRAAEVTRGAARSIAAWAAANAAWQTAGAFSMGMIPLVDAMFAKTLAASAVTSVEYAGRLWNLAPLLFTGYLTLAYAQMSRTAAAQPLDKRGIRILAVRLGLAAFLVSLVAIALSRPLIDLLYGAGVMDNAARENLANLLSCYLIGAGPFVASLVYARALSAEGRVRLMAIGATLNALVNLAGDATLIKLYGLSGIGLATSATYTFSLLFLMRAYHRWK
jgi:peptidoglycan biosynthesis protein MviN/MurJ (putative lipid II flippase)